MSQSRRDRLITEYVADVDEQSFRQAANQIEAQTDRIQRDISSKSRSSAGGSISKRAESVNVNLRGVSDQMGDFDTALSTLGSAMGGTGGAALSMAGEVNAVGEAMIRGGQGAQSAVSSIMSFAAANPMVAAGAAAAAVAVAAAAVALGQYTAAAAEQAARFTAFMDASRALDEQIVAGTLTLEQANEARRVNTGVLEREKARLAELQQGYDNLTGATGNLLQKLFSPLIKIFDNREEALAEQIAKSEENIKQREAENKAYENAIKSGELASDAASDTASSYDQTANAARNAASAERELASARSSMPAPSVVGGSACCNCCGDGSGTSTSNPAQDMNFARGGGASPSEVNVYNNFSTSNETRNANRVTQSIERTLRGF